MGTPNPAGSPIAATPKWSIEKCRRGRKCWHVYSPCPEADDDDGGWFYCPDYEFRTGAEAIAFVQSQLRAAASLPTTNKGELR